MIVVSDTTPVRYMILIGEVDLLPKILGDIIIPTEVFREFTSNNAPATVRDYLATLPTWLTVRSAKTTADAKLFEVDPGEREAILLAEELGADAIVIDDGKARSLAIDRGLQVIGTLGVLKLAAEAGYIDLTDAFERIKDAGFYMSRELEVFFLKG